MKYVDSISELIKENRDSRISAIRAIKLPHENLCTSDTKNNFFFCGSVVDTRGHVIGIPNKYAHILDINPDDDTILQWGELSVNEKKGWSGGCLAADGFVYGFPRGRDAFLKISTQKRIAEEIPIGIKYDSDHHYGGAINSNGVIYCPPRWHGNVLAYDILKKKIWEIPLPPHIIGNDSFYGAVCDLYDNIFFFPRGDAVKVLKCSPGGELSYIGKTLLNAHFNSGCIAADDDVYGFGAYKNGVLHIHTANDTVEILEESFAGGCFGAKLAYNGKVYGIPGNSDNIIEFDAEKKSITAEIPLPGLQHGQKAKCAGGVIDRYGNIWCVPAMGEYIYKIQFNGIKVLPSERLYRSKYFTSVY